MEDYIKFEKDNNILLIRFDTFPNHLNRKNYYNDAIEQRMNKLETDNPEAYQRYLKEKEEDRDFEEKLRLLDELDYGKKTEMFRHIAIAGLALELDPETRDAFFVDNFKNRQGSDTDRNGLNKVNTKAYIKFLRDDLYPLPLYDEIKKAILKEYEDKPEAITLINEAIEDVEAD